MSRYVLSPRAQQDLDEIWEYTSKTWGERQAEAYLRLLQRAIEVIADDPRSGRPCEKVRAGYRRYSAAAHMLFYRTIDAGIDIVRVLHGHMDFERHL